MQTQQCMICSKEFPQNMIISGHGIHHKVERLIINDNPNWNDSSYICRADYERYRIQYITDLIKEENGQIEKLEAEVIRTIQNNEIISSNINTEFTRYKISERISDVIAKFGGSWKFIISFFVILLAWIMINSYI